MTTDDTIRLAFKEYCRKVGKSEVCDLLDFKAGYRAGRSAGIEAAAVKAEKQAKAMRMFLTPATAEPGEREAITYETCAEIIRALKDSP